MNDNDIDVHDFETRLRRELHRRAGRLPVTTPGRFRPPDRRQRGPLVGATVAAGVIVIALVAALATSRLGDGSATHLRTPAEEPTTTLPAGISPEHLTIARAATTLRAAEDLPAPASTPPSGATYATVTYRAPGALRAPIVHASLARSSDQALPGAGTNPPYHPIDVGGRDGEIVRLGADVADLAVRVDDAHILDLSSWGLTQDQLVNAARSVLVHSDTSFELPGLPAGLEAFDAAPSSLHGGSRSEWSSADTTAVLYDYAGDPATVLGVLLYAGSGTQVGMTTIEPVTVDGARALLRIDRLAYPDTAAGVQPLSFDAVWQREPGHTVEVTGGASDRTAITDLLASVKPVDDRTWHDMVARCPWPKGTGRDTSTHC